MNNPRLDEQRILDILPRFERFTTIAELHSLAAELQQDPRFNVELAGLSSCGRPIHHISIGNGEIKALVVAYPHCMEPIGGMTMYGLLRLLQQPDSLLLNANIQWNFVPCIDPDGAILNSAWTDHKFSFEKYFSNYYVQPPEEQVDGSFPVNYKDLHANKISQEAGVLKTVIDKIMPHFFFSLHNTRIGGAFFYSSRDLGYSARGDITNLLKREGLPLQTHAQWSEMLEEYEPGFLQITNHRMIYDYLENVSDSPESSILIKGGTSSWDYLQTVNPGALSFVAEVGYAQHPWLSSKKNTGRNLRQFKLNIDAENLYLASIILDEWNRLKAGLNQHSPFYRTVSGGWVVPDPEGIAEGGMPVARYPLRDILLNPEYDRSMTEEDVVNAAMIDGGFFYTLFASQFLRLLRDSKQTRDVRQAHKKVSGIIENIGKRLTQEIGGDLFESFSFDQMARVQLGSGIIALNSVLDTHEGGL